MALIKSGVMCTCTTQFIDKRLGCMQSIGIQFVESFICAFCQTIVNFNV